MELIIDNKLIITPIEQILTQLRYETHGVFLKEIKGMRNNHIMITCPWHKDGQEQHPSCSVLTERDNPNYQYGVCHCFTCGTTAPLYSLVGRCLNADDEVGKLWLIERFGNVFVEKVDYLEPICLNNNSEQHFIDDSILDNYSYFHPYMFQRGLNADTIRKFKVGFNEATNSITFPLWDCHGNLIGITERNVLNKKFYIPEEIDKPVYLLNYVINENITDVWVCESQINTLLCWQRGKPAIGLIGTGTTKQYEILKKSGIRSYHLAFDGDEAGDKGIQRFIRNMPDDVLIDVVAIPRGKDVADLTDEEFNNLTIYAI